MKNERRSLYRVLHVQPEAPTEIIAAAYRCMMSKLRHHPDLGGDHETALEINHAYAVLGNPAKRQAYDLSRRHKRPVAGGGATPAPPPEAAKPARSCPFCGTGIPRIVAVETRCTRCDSPLAPIAFSMNRQRETAGRRGASRVSRNETATLYLAPGRRASSARLRDLSPTGISIYSSANVAVGSNIRIVTGDADLVAHVVQVRARESLQLVHARLLTALFAAQPGLFVSVRA